MREEMTIKKALKTYKGYDCCCCASDKAIGFINGWNARGAKDAELCHELVFEDDDLHKIRRQFKEEIEKLSVRTGESKEAQR